MVGILETIFRIFPIDATVDIALNGVQDGRRLCDKVVDDLQLTSHTRFKWLRLNTDGFAWVSQPC